MTVMTLLLLLIVFLSLTTIADPLTTYCDPRGGNYTSDSLFESNLNDLFSSLASLSNNSSFNTSTRGSTPDIAYGLFLCRGDVGTTECNTCVLEITQNALVLCPSNKEVTIWYDTCQLRYSATYFFSSVDNWSEPVLKVPVAPDPKRFDDPVRELMNNLSSWAAYNSSDLFYATGEVEYRDEKGQEVIYGMVQCTGDLTKIACYLCLQQMLVEYWGSSEPQIYREVLGKSCNFRYGVDKFFNGEPTVLINYPALQHSSTPLREDDRIGHKTLIIVIIVLSLVIVLALALAVCIFFRMKSTQNIQNTQGMARTDEISTPELLYYDLFIIRNATSDFSDANKLGEGGFGKVYKGLLPNGEIIAVKRLSASSRQGIGELKNELLLVAKLQHRNLVRLRGVCLEGQETLLVYEYMPNGSLDKFIFDRARRQELNWDMRFKIIGGIARGLVYLHEESHLKVIHRDLKASNVLLDANMKPKISDFGMARLFHDKTKGVTSRVVGTYGYMAPEYARHGRISIKLDVYSYGILVLEIVTGKKNINFKYDSEESQDLISYAWEHWKKGTALAILDPTLGDDCPTNEVFRCIQIGLLCAQEVPADRPSMSSVFFMLNSPSMPLQIPLQPTFLAGMTMDSGVSSNSKHSNFVSTGDSSTSSLLSSQQSGPSNTQLPQELNSEEKVVHSDSMINQPKV